MEEIYSMARHRGNKKEQPPAGSGGEDEAPDTGGRLPALPELVRKAFSLGFSGFFLTEEVIRKALGDTIPKDWTDFAADQSERARREFLERLSFEIAQSLEKIDVAAVLRELLEGRTLEVRAEIRLGEKEPGPGRYGLSTTLRRTGEDR
jgi:hypothetical protein